MFRCSGTRYGEDVRDMQRVLFQGKKEICRRKEVCRGTPESMHRLFVRDCLLPYMEVVDLWNTTSTLAFSTGNDVLVRVDRPVGIAALYSYDRTNERLPPPPRPPIPCNPGCFEGVNICPTFDSDKVKHQALKKHI